MARYVEGMLKAPTKRLELKPRKKPYWQVIGPRQSLGYRRTKTTGKWVVRIRVNDTQDQTQVFATADDYEAADGVGILTFYQAQEKARSLTPDTDSSGGLVTKSTTIITCRKALEDYEESLKRRDANPLNATQVVGHMSSKLLDMPLAIASFKDFADFQKSLFKKDLARASINRIGNSMKAGFNLAAKGNKRIKANSDAWTNGYESLPDADEARSDVILSDKEVARLCSLAYSVEDYEFGVLFETHAETGARTSQILRALVKHLDLTNRKNPVLMMPSSKKGRGKKRTKEEALTIPLGLAVKLQKMAGDRGPNDRLLINKDGAAWGPKDHYRRALRVVAAADLKKPEGAITIYALRHSSIVRQLMARVPDFVVAQFHDTSTKEIRDHYGKYIMNHAHDLVRESLLNVSKPQLVA